MNKNKALIKQHVEKKLSQRMKFFFFISLALIIVVVYEVIITGYNPLFALGFELLGIVIGVLVSRMFRISWNEDEQQVISRMDTLGGIILGCYIVFSFARYYLLSIFIQNSFIFVVTFTLVSGIMIGRFLGMRYNILKILKDNNIL